MKVTKTVSKLLHVGWKFRRKDQGDIEKAPDSGSDLSHGYQVLFELLGITKMTKIIEMNL